MESKTFDGHKPCAGKFCYIIEYVSDKGNDVEIKITTDRPKTEYSLHNVIFWILRTQSFQEVKPGNPPPRRIMDDPEIFSPDDVNPQW